jgi:putative phosphoribosyl transferase
MPHDTVGIPVPGAVLGASLAVPPGARGLVLFPHSSALRSRRHRRVARALHARGLATLLVDLLAPEEDVVGTEARSFDVDFLAERLIGATDWARRDSRTAELAPCYFGSGRGAAVALVAAAWRHDEIRAVVSCSGLADAVAGLLPDVDAPTLIIVEGGDATALALGRVMLRRLTCHRRLEVMAGTVCSSAAQGAVDPAQLSADWFLAHLAGSTTGRFGSAGRADLRAADAAMRNAAMNRVGAESDDA